MITIQGNIELEQKTKRKLPTKKNFIKIIEYPVAPHATSLIPPPNLKPPLLPPTSFLSPSPTHPLSRLIPARISLSAPSPFVPTFVCSPEIPYVSPALFLPPVPGTSLLPALNALAPPPTAPPPLSFPLYPLKLFF